jgi:hypothetical protein
MTADETKRNEKEHSRIRLLGIASNSAEARSGAIVKGSDGKFYGLFPSLGFLVCYDFEEGTSTQHFYENNKSGAPFKSFASKAGKFYTGANAYFYEFDPALKDFTSVIHMGEWGASLTGWGFCEDDEGIVYFSNYPRLHLYSFDPKTKKIQNFGLIDPVQKYCFSQGADSKGWIYNAIGTAEVNVVGVHLETGERRFMFPRIPGTGKAEVYKTKEGKVAARVTVNGKTEADGEHLGKWFLLEDGKVISEAEEVSHDYHGNYPWGLHVPFEKAPVLEHMDYPSKSFTYRDPATGEIKRGDFHYDCDGADCSPITLGPDGIIYGTTNHPMNIFTVDPKTDVITDHGIKSIGRGVGNICCYAYQGDILVGAAYSGGYIYRIDTKLGIVNERANVSPKQEAKVEAIHRPRSSLALSDGRTCLFSGYGGYGVVGGGMAIYDVETRITRILENKDLLEYHGILAMAELPSGKVLCGSTVLAPGGGRPVYDTAALFEFDPKTYEIGNITYPFKGVPEIAHLVRVKEAVYGITSTCTFFVYNYKEGKLLRQEDFSAYGSVVRQGMVYKHGVIYLLMSGALLKIDPSDYTVSCVEKLTAPARSGIAVTDDAVYYCSASRVYKICIEEEKRNLE